MASQSLYRKWRSQTFSDLVGQEAVTRTLLNAVREGRLAHAYLFCGPRGTGKTSSARLLAKAINCANPHDGEPCNACVSCREITAGHSPDVIEIDAASNTGVDSIRELRENVGLLGSGGRYKVYVVDECFAYGELVTLADGTKMPIGKLVESQWQGEVLSYNEQTGAIEPKHIARHMRKPTQVPTVRVTFDNNRSIICTINHKFYTPAGQLCAGHLQVGQFVYTNRERITQQQRAAIMGAAIGDGHIALTGSAMRARLRMNHGVAQREYLDYKVRLLGDLVRADPRYQDGVGTYSKLGTYQVTTLSRPEIAEIHHALYGMEGRKQLTRAYLDQLDEIGLALWYLDDGSLTTQRHRYERVGGGESFYPVSRTTFSTYGFTVEEAWLMCGWLRERWGIEARVSSTAKGPVVWLTAEATQRLHELIAPYVPPSMEYKLLPAYRGQFQMPEDDGIMSGLAVSVVRATELVPMPEYVYNIEVEDNHNYFVRDMLVANCHMLTVSAFNALLKTLEEPPPHVIFVLATTEAHKVLPTVVSRCQRFDFHRISTREIVAHLRRVAEGEGLRIEPAAAELLARAAQGGMRDALSLLDQAVAFCGEQVDLERTRTMLGLADPAAVRALLVHVAEGQSAEGLHQIHQLVETGAELRQVQLQLAEEWRALLLARAGANVAEVMDRGDEEAREIAALADRFSLEELMACARVFARTETPARGLPVPQLALELMFLECVGIRRQGGMPAVAPAPQPTRPSARMALPPYDEGPPTPRGAAQPAARPIAAATATHAQALPAQALPAQALPAPAVEELDLEAIERDTAPVPMPAHMPAQPLPVSLDEPAPDELMWEDAPAAEEPPARADGATPGATASGDDGLQRIQRGWEMIHRVSRQKGPKVAALLKDATPIELEPGNPPVIVLAVKYTFHLGKLREPASREVIEWAIQQVLEVPLKVRFVLAGGQGQPVKSRADGGPGASTPRDGNSASHGANNGASHGAMPPGRLNGASNGHSAAPARAYDPSASGTGEPPRATAPATTQVRDAQPAYPAYQAPSPHGAMPSIGSAPVFTTLEDEVRADPIIQEILRTCGAELTDVRPLASDEAE